MERLKLFYTSPSPYFSCKPSLTRPPLCPMMGRGHDKRRRGVNVRLLAVGVRREVTMCVGAL